ncbi:hypothetical protein Lepto7375DRAFT_2986 [Leptolyngbya sp. PCC 7375]|nr:hypothetical protein Lepto7375DRAFT_2986 [Leptolyngbya sp. PCC 7375]
MNDDWPFDQAKNVAAMTTRQVLDEHHSILRVVHYSDDHSWAFTCGTTDDPKDGKVVGMGCIVDIDPTLKAIADLPPGWGAWRETVGGSWTRYSSLEL